jgi:hypothetical protein
MGGNIPLQTPDANRSPIRDSRNFPHVTQQYPAADLLFFSEAFTLDLSSRLEKDLGNRVSAPDYNQIFDLK